jgi:hypothetical protein
MCREKWNVEKNSKARENEVQNSRARGNREDLQNTLCKIRFTEQRKVGKN